MSRRAFARPRPSRLAAALLWLVAALLLGQSLGSMHRIVHAARQGASTWAAQLDDVRHATDAGAQRPAAHSASLQRWFAGHGEAACVLFDEALQPTPVAAPASLQSPPRTIFLPPAAPVGVALSGGCAGFDARGPPFLNRRLSS